MSAFIVSRTDIQQLIAGYEQYINPLSDPTETGQMLWNENIASVSHRYNDEPLADLPGPIGETYMYAHVAPAAVLPCLSLYKLCRSYDYQSCERDAWHTSDAKAFSDALKAALLAEYGATHHGMTADQILHSRAYENTPRDLDELAAQDAAPPAVSWSDARPITLLDTAKLLRQALREAYPTVKFSVRSERYAGGKSITVSWMDGPTQSQVDQILQGFTSKSFDGMDDSTHHHTQQYHGETVRFGADYVSGHRSISPAFMGQIAAKVAARYGAPVPTVKGTAYGFIDRTGDIVPSDRYDGGGEDLAEAVHHTAYATSALSKPRIRLLPTVHVVAEE